jgi:predicted transcriptional regulator
MAITSVRIQPEISKQLEKVAVSLHRSKSSIINQAVEEFLQHQQIEQQRWQETLEALQSVRAGQVTSGDAVHTWLESWGSDNELPAPKPGE